MEDKDKKFLAWENIIKGVITSLIGLVAILGAGYGYWNHHLSETPSAVIALVGFILFGMRDEIPGFVRQVIKKFIG